ncbi:M57 family metalloprotease [Janibacter sp. GS2]|uniref:M57 family metalloprotease n=1 Tax=Janibacter sp. GS2 TaxID=3442646 RepID=UPI003EB79140
MKRTTKRSVSVFAVAATISLGATSLGYAGEGDEPSYKEFKSQTYQDPNDGQYIVNGDIPVQGEKQLRDFYQDVVNPTTPSDGLIVNTVYGNDDLWSASQAKNLTYCVSSDFGADHQRIADAMEAGGNQWEAASSGVDFTHDASQDDNCTTRNNNVLFSVEPVTGTNYIARAFFPSTRQSTRNVLVNTDQIFGAGAWTPDNVLAHELGHSLGFRHEHTRPEAGTCFEDSNWRPLTPYDSSSIMHYPQCNGTSSDLSMTEQDREGIRSVYGS